jgi:hypothetical protein
MKSSALLLLIFLTISAPVLAAHLIVNESVGQAGSHILTSREVQIASVIEHILYPNKDETKLYEIKPEDGRFPNEVTSLLLETIVSLEADSFNVGKISDDEMKVALEKVEKATKGKAYWDNLDVSSTEEKKRIAQKVLAKNFIKFKTESLNGIITDSDAQTYYEKNKAKFGSVPFPQVKENIRTFLSQQQLQERLRTWFEVIKRKYKARNFLLEKKGQ